MYTNGDQKINNESTGLTKREYFAAKILQGFVVGDFGNEVCECAVDLADKLIKALNEKEN